MYDLSKAYIVSRRVGEPGLKFCSKPKKGFFLPGLAAMNECDFASPAAGGGTGAQFRAGVEVTLDREPAGVVAALLKACSGQMVDIGAGC